MYLSVGLLLSGIGKSYSWNIFLFPYAIRIIIGLFGHADDPKRNAVGSCTPGSDS